VGDIRHYRRRHEVIARLALLKALADNGSGNVQQWRLGKENFPGGLRMQFRDIRRQVLFQPALLTGVRHGQGITGAAANQ